MTTIAIDGVTIAADGLRTRGSEICGLDHRKLKVDSGAVYAFTGKAPMFGPMVEWHLKGAKPDDLPKGADKDDDSSSWTLIVIDGDGIGKYSSSCLYIERFDPPIAFGAGCDYALGAMLAGASARQAVEIACKVDVWSGGEIQIVNIAEAIGLQKVREAAE